MALDMVVLGLSLLLVGVIAQYGNFRKGIENQLNWIASGGFMFLVASVWETGVAGFGFLAALTPTLMNLFQGLGALFVLVGTVWATVKLVKV